MTMRNVSLTALATLTATLAAGAMAQQATNDTADAVVVAPAQAEVVTPAQAEAVVPAQTEPAQQAAQDSAQDSAASSPDTVAVEGNAAQAEAVAEDTRAADAAADQAAASQAATPEAEAVSTQAEDAPAGTEAETAEQEVNAAAPEVAETSALPSDEHAAASGHAVHQEITNIAFSFEGPFGTYDQHQLQRGLQIYTEVCSACHGMRYVPLRTLSDKNGPGIPEDQVRAYAANLSIVDKETGEERPRGPSDHFPYIPKVEGTGPDLSLMAKARAGFHGPVGTGLNQLVNGIGGPEYIYSILTHYTGETKEEAGTTLYENTAFPGGWIAMPPPLSADSVTYEDGTEATLDQEAQDIAAFLMWAAEPKMMDRKQVGLVSVLFLVVLSVLLYLTNKRLWAPYKHKHRPEDLA